MSAPYPDSPGYKERETSRDAARNIKRSAEQTRADALAYIAANPGKTSDEVAQALGESVLKVRPRISELRTSGKVVSAGRGTNASGQAAHRWRAAAPDEVEEEIVF